MAPASRVQVTGGTANAVLAFPGAASVGGGNVANLRAVEVAEVKAVVEAAIPTVTVDAGVGGVLDIRTVATGPGASVQAAAATAAAFGLDTTLHSGAASGTANAVRVEGKDPGAYANRIEAEVRAATSGSPSAFDLLVVEDGVYREAFPNLSMNPSDGRYVERIVNDARNGSVYVRVIDQLLVGAPIPPPQTVALAGGSDGLVGLDDNDFIGSEPGKTGLHALDQVQELSLLLVPGRATPAVHNAMVRYCEVDRDGAVFAILDPPANQSATDIVTYVATTAALGQLSEFGAIYWPRVKVLNPAKSVFGSAEQLVVPPSGIVAGVFSRTDSARPGGVYDPPAGIEAGRMFGVLGFETDEVLEERKRDLVYPHRINPLTTGPGLPRYIDGSRTLKGDGNFPYVAERRGVIFIERSLKQGLQFARHKNNTEGLRAQVRRTITAFLLAQMNNGAFRSRDPSKAFFVDVSDSSTRPRSSSPASSSPASGLATNKPAEFIILRISQDTRALEAELAAAGAEELTHDRHRQPPQLPQEVQVHRGDRRRRPRRLPEVQRALRRGRQRAVLRGRLAHPEQEPRPPHLRRRHARARRHPGPRPLRLVPGRRHHVERPRPHRRELQAQPRHRAAGPRRHHPAPLVALARLAGEVRRRRVGQRERRERHRVGHAHVRLLRAGAVTGPVAPASHISGGMSVARTSLSGSGTRSETYCKSASSRFPW
jgi:hypothetical protein